MDKTNKKWNFPKIAGQVVLLGLPKITNFVLGLPAGAVKKIKSAKEASSHDGYSIE